MAIDMGAVAGMVTSIKAAAEITKAMIGLRDAAMIQTKIIELNSVILSAQSSAFEANNAQSALLEQIRSLEASIDALEAWEREKEKYELKELTPHSYAYAIKNTARGNGPAHYIARRAMKRIKIIMQRLDSVHLKCPDCETMVTYKEINFNRPSPPRSSGWS